MGSTRLACCVLSLALPQGRGARWIEMNGNCKGSSCTRSSSDVGVADAVSYKVNCDHIDSVPSRSRSMTPFTAEDRSAEGEAETSDLDPERIQRERGEREQRAAYLWPSRSEASLVQRWSHLLWWVFCCSRNSLPAHPVPVPLTLTFRVHVCTLSLTFT
jgi:hypothetical protein